MVNRGNPFGKGADAMNTSSDFSAFRKNLRDLIDNSGKSSKDIALDIGISHITLSRYLNDHRDPDLKYVMKLSQYFRVSIDWLIGFSDDKFEALPPDIRDLVSLYSIASPDDRRVVEAVLSKYRKEC
jgi:transcriptional regulator with XRE-family HTH domain